jgi:hypothetical protein
MTIQSNLYVEKVNSEHPLAVWMLNDQLDYISLVTEANRYFEDSGEWTITNATASAEPNTSLTPFRDSHSSKLTGSVPSGPTMDIEALSVFEQDLNDYNAELANFAIGFNVYIETIYAKSVTFGYQYYDPLGLITIEETVTQLLNSADANLWKFYSHTFANPPSNAEDIKLLIRFNVESGGTTGDYNFILNGLTLGQWSEEFNRTSLGVIPTALPSNIAFNGSPNCIEALPYGTSSLNGYYISHDDKMYAINFGIPLVYGSSNVTRTFPHEHSGEYWPSVIFPGYGFLNERGKFNEYTVEMWVRLNSDAVGPRKFFGPITGADGLYVEDGFLTLVLGKNFGSFYVGEWMRPMLIQIRYVQNNVSMLVNGELVVSFDFIESDLDLPSEFNSSDESQDWLAFYSYEDLRNIDIDSFAIYPYSVPVEVAKRRWVWGQGVVAPETTNASLNATTAFNDYSFADYSVNYNYPDFASWRQAYFSNIETTANSLGLPQYALPEIFTDNLTQQQWLDDNQAAQTGVTPKYYTFRPNVSWSSKNCYLYFPEFGMLNERVESFYAVFESDGSSVNEPLFKIQNKITKDYFACTINGTTVTYTINISGTNTTVATKTITANEMFVVGFNISLLSLRPINGINKFFTNQSILTMYVHGDGTTTFKGKGYRIGLDAAYNNKKIENAYDSTGIFKISDTASITNVLASNNQITFTASNSFMLGDKVTTTSITSSPAGVFNLSDQTIVKRAVDNFIITNPATGTYTSGGTATVSQENRATTMINHTANYTIVPIEKYKTFFLDIGVSAYWEDYMPLSYFGRFTEDFDGEQYYDVDSIQVNLDYPEPLEIDAIESVSSWIYNDLEDRYDSPVQQTYSELDNNVYSGWDDYEDMEEDSTKYYYYKTEDNTVRAYVSFQKISEGANKKLIDFENFDVARTKGVADPSLVVTPWETTAYEVIDGSIVYPPTLDQHGNTVDFNDLALVYHLDFNNEGIIHHPVNFRELQFASEVLERQQFTPIGTKFGIPVYPYSRIGLYYNFKEKNPVSIYKGSTPYLYLNRHSGWRIRGDFNFLVDRGISIPVNSQGGIDIDVSAMQMWIRFADKTFPTADLEIFSIDFANGIYDFYLRGDESTQRGYIFAKNRETSQEVTNIQYYINGQYVDTPYIINEQWTVLGLGFPELISFDSYVGRINLNGPLTYNNVSYYLSTNLSKVQQVNKRTWSDVNDNTWSYWKNLNITEPDGTTHLAYWNNVLVISSTDIYDISPADIYKKYVGTDRIIIDDTSGPLSFVPEEFTFYNEVLWSTSTSTAV